MFVLKPFTSYEEITIDKDNPAGELRAITFVGQSVKHWHVYVTSDKMYFVAV